MTADAAWAGGEDFELVELPVCGLHFPDLASGAPHVTDAAARTIDLG